MPLFFQVWDNLIELQCKNHATVYKASSGPPQLVQGGLHQIYWEV